MGTLTTPALNLREMLARVRGLERRASSDLVRCDFTNLVTNGTFDADIVGWTASNSILTNPSGRISVADAGINSCANQSPPVTRGYKYALSVELISETAATSIFVGSLENSVQNDIVNDTSVSIGVTVNNFYSITNVCTISLVATSTGTSVFDNVSLYEADPSDDAPWLRLPYGYKVGKRGMIVRDGVVLHPSDYTEITDSGQTFIKPIVAPGASTEFSIWAGA